MVNFRARARRDASQRSIGTIKLCWFEVSSDLGLTSCRNATDKSGCSVEGEGERERWER